MERLQSRTTKTIDVGSVQFEDGQTRYFINELSMGLGPDVVRMIEKFPRLFPGKLKFAFAILITFLYYKRKRMDVQGAGFLHQDNTMAFVVSNGKYFGSGIGISPEAELNDGLLNVTIIGNVSLFDYLRQLGTLKRCEKVNHPKVSYHVLENLQILTQGSMETDGELSAPAPAKIQIIKSVLEIL